MTVPYTAVNKIKLKSLDLLRIFYELGPGTVTSLSNKNAILYKDIIHIHLKQRIVFPLSYLIPLKVILCISNSVVISLT